MDDFYCSWDMRRKYSVNIFFKLRVLVLIPCLVTCRPFENKRGKILFTHQTDYSLRLSCATVCNSLLVSFPTTWCPRYPSLTSLSKPSCETSLVRSGTDLWTFFRGACLLFARLARWVLPNFGGVISCAGSCPRCVALRYQRWAFVFCTECAGYSARHAELLCLLDNSILDSKLYNTKLFWI